MVKINLLPVRASRKKETAKQQIAITAVFVVTVLVAGLGLYSYLTLKIKSAKEEISQSETELQQLKIKVKEIENIKKLQEDVKKKLAVLDQLRKGKTGPVHRLATLSDSVPEKLWLTRYAESGVNVSISGIALNEDLIAMFMRSLQGSDDYSNIELIVSEQTDVGGVKAKKFDLNCVLKAGK